MDILETEFSVPADLSGFENFGCPASPEAGLRVSLMYIRFSTNNEAKG
ncbi:hypothetical protein [Algoriphagus sp. NG3]|nr:hypothetical protein [Algoriphagus sp. NG3]WPR75147.1 hypothetical protein SLW71_21020 [Algoriphagus sp. NG3]